MQRDRPSAADPLSAGVTRLGRLADTAAGRRAREALAARELLWPLLVVRRPPPPPGLGRAPGRRALLGPWTAFRSRLVTRESEACIEGFPRSANSFTLAAFRSANPGVRVANHLHASFQLRRAARFGVPCCVLVRRPLDAIVSVIVMNRGRVSADACLSAWLRFHRRALELADRTVVCEFDEVTADPSLAARRLNERFGTEFVAAALDPSRKAAILARLEERGRRNNWMLPEGFAPAPNPRKDADKVAVRERVARHPRLAEADELYRALAGAPTAR